ncbi:hypothetical protein LSTR_LSTR002151 [Laodelphax striatellus]|uniref:hydroxyisourate hydrolase n=1 Tax=Laodelphax striatellus TaxID=195883 RepID=A0A482XPL2_LAOST|nr:hypothetical protein LSTR_LSTR002151 [Laodelphax striatellus]
MDKSKNESDMDDDDVFGIFPDTPKISTPVHRSYKQQYRKAWEKESDFKGWLTSVADQPNKAYCKACKRILHAHRLTLVKHTISIKHMKAAVAFYESTKEKVNQSCEKIELQVDTSISEEEGSVLLVDEAFPIKKPEDGSTLNNDASRVSGQQLPNDSVLSGIQPYLIPNSCDNENRLNEELVDDPVASERNISSIPSEPARSLVLARPDKPPISTHVLDTTRGLPVSGIQVSLYQLINGRWTHLNDSCTNPDGRCADLIDRESVKPGRYKMHFETHQYFELRGLDCLFPFVEVVFDVRSPAEYLHIPVLMTPYSYSVYRGS